MKKIVFSLLLLLNISTVSAYEIVDLYHREARILLPSIQNMLQANESVSTIDNKIIINASPQRTQEITQLIKVLDQKTTMLLVEVEQMGQENKQSVDVRGEGNIDIGGRNRSSGRISAGAQQGKQNNSGIQTLRVMSGDEGYIELGRDQHYYDGMYRSVALGFGIRPTLIGNSVKLDIYAENKGQKIATSIQGQLGQWISIGGINSSEQSRSLEFFGYTNSNKQHNSSVRVRVTTIQ